MLRVRHLERPGWVWFSKDIAKGARERYVPALIELAPVVAEVIDNPTGMFVVPHQRPRNTGRGVSKQHLGRVVKRVAGGPGSSRTSTPTRSGTASATTSRSTPGCGSHKS